jgi:type II secretory pathway pseudopilin PulG
MPASARPERGLSRVVARRQLTRAARLGRIAGITLLEIIIAVSIFAVVLIFFFTMWNEAMDVGRIQTVQSELRARAQFALDRIVNDLRSTNTNPTFQVSTSLPGAGPTDIVSFYLITTTNLVGTTNLGLPLPAPVLTKYTWDPSKTTGLNEFGKDWTLSQIILTTYDVAANKSVPPTVLVGGVTQFTIVPANGAIVQNGEPQTVLVTLQLSRKHLFQPKNPPLPVPPPDQPYLFSDGAVTVTLTTNVTIPGGQ